jgi:hypothetical protein
MQLVTIEFSEVDFVGLKANLLEVLVVSALVMSLKWG